MLSTPLGVLPDAVTTSRQHCFRGESHDSSASRAGIDAKDTAWSFGLDCSHMRGIIGMPYLTWHRSLLLRFPGLAQPITPKLGVHASSTMPTLVGTIGLSIRREGLQESVRIVSHACSVTTTNTTVTRTISRTGHGG
jgi:hypothetical protein